LYIIPRYRTAFVNPFTEIPTLEILCYEKNRIHHESIRRTRVLYQIIPRRSVPACRSQREYFEKDGILPPGVIENVVSKLKAFEDKGLSEKLFNKNEEIGALVMKFLHCS
jgi:hypothetical protein